MMDDAKTPHDWQQAMQTTLKRKREITKQLYKALLENRIQRPADRGKEDY